MRDPVARFRRLAVWLVGCWMVAGPPAGAAVVERPPDPDARGAIRSEGLPRELLPARPAVPTELSSCEAREDPAAAPERAEEGEPEEPPTFVPVYDPEDEGAAEPERWTSFLPLFGRSLLRRGYDLPLPIGLSVNYLHIDRDVDVGDVRVSVGGGPERDVDRFVDLDADSSLDVVMGRLDVWLLPFLNVHGYAGFQSNRSQVDVNVSIPLPGPFPPVTFRIHEDKRLEGPTYGGGLQLAGGYDGWFATAGADFAFAELDELDSSFEGRIYGLRSGWQGSFREVAVRAWTGATYYDTEVKVEGRIDAPVLGSARYSVKERPQHPWNGLIGLNVGPTRFVDVVFEYGFNFDDVHIFTLLGTLRF